MQSSTDLLQLKLIASTYPGVSLWAGAGLRPTYPMRAIGVWL
jgi:hypothetical protein